MNKAKQFEINVKNQISSLDDFIIIRLYDVMGGLTGVCNICDYIAYNYPTLYLLELKTHAGASLPFSAIRDNQWDGLYDAVKKSSGVVAGILCWYYEKDVTLFIPIALLEKRKKEGKKSIRFDDKEAIVIGGVKKRTYFIYDFNKFFKEVNVGESK